jgi:hypothetical protein
MEMGLRRSNPMPHVLRLISGVFVDVWHRTDRPSDLVDMKRVNAELRRAALAGVDDDVVYRERVKQKIREGARCTHPPLIDRRKVLRYRAASLVADIAS